MALKFLSEEWAQQVTEKLNASEQFSQAAGGQNAKLQQVVSTPDGETKYYFKIEDGRAEVALGELDGAETTITQDYDTAVAMSKNELSPTAAYMSGKIKVSGDLMRLMQLQGVIGALPGVLAELDVEY
ncbi:MAG TPA: SCP2 sterol-binding domain-containing protein [Actinomycetota bacterium]